MHPLCVRVFLFPPSLIRHRRLVVRKANDVLIMIIILIIIVCVNKRYNLFISSISVYSLLHISLLKQISQRPLRSYTADNACYSIDSSLARSDVTLYWCWRFFVPRVLGFWENIPQFIRRTRFFFFF